MLSGLEASDILSSVLTTATILIGIATFYLTYTKEKRKEREARERELEKGRRDQRIKVYSEYLQVATGSNAKALQRDLDTQMAILDDVVEGKVPADGDPGRRAIAAQLAQIEQERDYSSAHANIVTYGSKEVIARLSALYDCVERAKGNPFEPSVNRALLDLIAAMRRDSFAQDYDEFIEHADNILGAGAQARAVAIAEAQRAAAEKLQAKEND
ncbi:MAG: hypothetical protein AAFQ27_02845 [Pseudomonadota bacterium]